MAVTEEQANLPITKNAELVSNYGDKFITVKENATLYLIYGTVISKYNAIASIDVSNNCKIYDRDKANLFVDWSHVHYQKPKQIEDLSEQQIKDYLIFYLQNDVHSLIAFDNFKIEGDFGKVFNKLSEQVQLFLLQSLNDVGLYDLSKQQFLVPYVQLYTKEQMQWAHENKYTFLCVNAEAQAYDCCSRTDDGKYYILAKNIAKNASCGSKSKFCKDFENYSYIIFNQKPGLSFAASENLEKQIAEDMEGSAYYAANKFIKLEEKFEKSMQELTQTIAEQNAFVDMSKIHYPEIDSYAEIIAKTVRAYKRNPDDAVKKQEYKNILLEAYTSAYTELQKAQDSLKALYALLPKNVK